MSKLLKVLINKLKETNKEEIKETENKNIPEEEKDLECPICKSKDKAMILYGMPIYNEQLEIELENGDIVLGGCCIATYIDDEGYTVYPPKYKCKECDEKFYNKRVKK